MTTCNVTHNNIHNITEINTLTTSAAGKSVLHKGQPVVTGSLGRERELQQLGEELPGGHQETSHTHQ